MSLKLQDILFMVQLWKSLKNGLKRKLESWGSKGVKDANIKIDAVISRKWKWRSRTLRTLSIEGVCKKWHLILGRKYLGGEELQAWCDRKLFWIQKIWRLKMKVLACDHVNMWNLTILTILEQKIWRLKMKAPGMWTKCGGGSGAPGYLMSSHHCDQMFQRSQGNPFGVAGTLVGEEPLSLD